MKSPKRAGFSLLEVLIATSILLGSVIVLGELARIGRKHIGRAQEMAQAQRLCQQKLNEYLAGISPIDPVEDEAFEEAPDWTYTLEVQPLDNPGLVALRVTVAPEPSATSKINPYTLIRWVPNPNGQESVTSSQTTSNSNSSYVVGGPVR